MEIEISMGSFSIWHWLVVLAIIILIFGTKKLKNIGTDIGEAVKNFKNAISGNSEKEVPKEKDTDTSVDKSNKQNG